MPTVLATVTGSHSGSGPCDAAAITPAADEALVAIFHQTNSASDPGYTVSDDQGNTWGLVAELGNLGFDKRVELWKTTGSLAAASTVVSVSWPAGTRSIELSVFRADEALTLDQSDSFEETTNVTTANLAASGNIDTAADVLVFGGCTRNANVGAHTGKVGWTAGPNTDRGYYSHYISSASALTNERGEVSSTGTARLSVGVIASFTGAGGGGGTTADWYNRLQELAA